MTSSTPPSPKFPAYLLHAPFLSISSSLTSTAQLLQRTLPPSPLYYLHAPPVTSPGSLPPALTLDTSSSPVQGRISRVYRATSPSGTRVVLKYSQDFLALSKEAEEVFVNLPQGGALPIPTYYGIFQGKVEPSQPTGLVTVLEDRGEPLPNDSFDDLTKPEKQYLYDTLKTLHDIHFSHGSFSPASIVQSIPPRQPQVSPPSTSTPDSTTTTRTETGRHVEPPGEEISSTSSTSSGPSRQLTLVGFSQSEWHLCTGETSCPELVEAKRALGL